MAKKIKQVAGEEAARFSQFYSQLPGELQKMLDAFKVTSFEDLLGLSAMMGIDPEKMFDYTEKYCTGELPPIESVRFDDDHPMASFSNSMFGPRNEEDMDTDDTYGEEEWDPWLLPDNIFIESETAKEYHLRIKLKNSPVPVWREVKIPSNVCVEFLAHVIITAMGWNNTHLHQFKDGNIIYKNRHDLMEGSKILHPFFSRAEYAAAEDHSIADLLKEKQRRVIFEYDFGDSWEHEVWIKGIRDYAEGEEPTLAFVKGTGACPPEDCGGVWGYADLLKIRSQKRKSAEDKRRLEWYGIDRWYDPEDCDAEFIVEELEGLWEEGLS